MSMWDFTQLVIHVLLAFSCASLFCTAPDHFQKYCVLLPISVAALVLVTMYAVRLMLGIDPWLVDDLKRFAYAVEHGAVMFYILRLIIKEKLSCKNLSRHSPHFQD